MHRRWSLFSFEAGMSAVAKASRSTTLSCRGRKNIGNNTREFTADGWRRRAKRLGSLLPRGVRGAYGR
uniref:Uncharacterized protein n=1 Tax=Parascaris equorum TaxID=6256 RepID=A0A914RYU8_PAREQ